MKQSLVKTKRKSPSEAIPVVVNRSRRLGTIFSVAAVMFLVAGLAFAVIGSSHAAFTPPTSFPPYGNPGLPSALSGTPGKLSYWEQAFKLGSVADLDWDGSLLTVKKLRIGAGAGVAGKFLKAADASGNVTWSDVDPTLYQAKLSFPSGATACPTGQVVSNIDQAGVVTCSTVGSGFDFSISNSTNNVSMQQGASNVAAGTITMTTTAGIGQVVDFSIDPSTPLPTGVTASFSPTWCVAKIGTSCTSSLSLYATNSASMTPPTTSFKIKGASGSLSRSTAPVSLTITPGVQFTFVYDAYNINAANYTYTNPNQFPTTTLGSYSAGGYNDYFFILNNSGSTATTTVSYSATATQGGLYFNWRPGYPNSCGPGGYCTIVFEANLSSAHYHNYTTTITLTATNGTSTVARSFNIYVP